MLSVALIKLFSLGDDEVRRQKSIQLGCIRVGLRVTRCDQSQSCGVERLSKQL